MRAWQVAELGEPADVLHEADRPEPVPGPGEVVLDVAAAALNFTDVLMCRGEYQMKPELPFVPGSECAGTIIEIGTGVNRFAKGDRVIAIPKLGTGAFAQRALAFESSVFSVPESMSWEQAAAFHVVYQTSHIALHRRGRLQRDETLLVHAGAGGVGSAAIQLGRAGGARVIATAGGVDKRDRCLALGAHHAIDYRSDDFVAIVKELTDGNGADVIFDPVGGDVFDRSRKCIAFEGRILVVGFASGRIPDAPANHALIKNYSVVGVNWGLYGLREPTLIPRVHADLVRLFETGEIAPFVSEVVDFESVPSALTRLGSRNTSGKVVVRIPSND